MMKNVVYFHRNIAKFSIGMMLAFSVAFGILPNSYAQSDEEKGLMIAKEADSRAQGFKDFSASQTMILRNKEGKESKRELRVKVLEVVDDGNKSVFVFDNPKDVKGTAFLIHAHKDSADDQWLYLPALKRVKRISSSNKSGSFMGSEFSYEDLASKVVEKYTYRFLGDEPCGDLMCHLVERTPVEKKSAYKREVVYYDHEELRVWQVDYYDRKDSHLKTLVLEEYSQYNDKFWRANLWNMVNHLTGKSTTMIWEKFEFGTDLSERDFTTAGIKRIR